MNAARRQRIGSAFAAAHGYDRHARVQQAAAVELAAELARLDLPARARVLEFGCGTGFLTEAAARLGVAGDWLATDIAPEMVARCRARMADLRRCRFAVLDAELDDRPGEPGFDLICANLAVQWFADLPAAVLRLSGWLAPGGRLVFTTLAADTFAEWRTAHALAGVACGLIALPTVAALRAMHPAMQSRPHTVKRHVDHAGTARDFVRGLKAIGAATSAPEHRPLAPAAMRRVMNHFEDTGARATYEIVTCRYGAAETRA